MSIPLYIREVKERGRGVFSGQAIPDGELIESCPLLILKPEDFYLVTSTFLNQYVFFWDKEYGELCIGLGFASLYNHSCPSNASYFMNHETQTMEIFSVRPIAPNEEITINYNGEPDNPSVEWFKGKGIIIK
ncbi:SET domain-containing protein-lysine N-methyltransferase [Flavitalea flava]